MKPQRPFRFLVTLNATVFGLTLWSRMTNPNLYHYKLEQMVPHGEVNTWLSLCATVALIVATFAQPLIGVVSDRTRSRFGRRAPYLLTGLVGVVAALIAIAVAPSVTLLVLAIMFGQIASNTIQGPWQALSPDQLPHTQKGSAAGVKAIFELLGVIASGLIIQLFLAHDQVLLTVLVVSTISVITTLVTVFNTPDFPADPATERDRPARHLNPFAGALLAWRHLNPISRHNLSWWLVNRFLFWAGLTAVQQFIIGYMRDAGHYSEGDAQAVSGQFIYLLGIGAALVTLPAGLLSDRIGRVRIIIFSGLMACLGAGLLIFTRSAQPLLLIAVLAGAGVGMYFSVNWALITVLVPAAEAALFLGIANMATTLGSITGQVGGPLIDTINRLTGTVNGYYVVFGIAALFFLMSALAISRVQEIAPSRFDHTNRPGGV
jgi:MFS family permease